MHPRRLIAVVLALACGLPACGEGPAGPALPDAAADGPADRCPAGPPSACPNDPAPCPGRCNAKGYCELDCDLGPQVRIPPGTVVMGSDGSDAAITIDVAIEQPEHLATLTRPYYVDKYEVTVGAYRRCVEAGACEEAAGLRCNYGGLPQFWPGNRWPAEIAVHDRHPINCMSWVRAFTFCTWKGARLPTEAEWMLAGRGPAGPACQAPEDLAATDGRCNRRFFPWGNETDARRANVNVPDGTDPVDPRSWRGMTTTPVGFFDGAVHNGYETRDGSSVFGVHDLVGNLAELVNDWFDPGYYARAERNDPRGPATGSERIGMNIHWGQGMWPFRPLASRGKIEPDVATEVLGFRCARDAE